MLLFNGADSLIVDTEWIVFEDSRESGPSLCTSVLDGAISLPYLNCSYKVDARDATVGSGRLLSIPRA